MSTTHQEEYEALMKEVRYRIIERARKEGIITNDDDDMMMDDKVWDRYSPNIFDEMI